MESGAAGVGAEDVVVAAHPATNISANIANVPIRQRLRFRMVISFEFLASLPRHFTAAMPNFKGLSDFFLK
jgi:hypothetical protein